VSGVNGQQFCDEADDFHIPPWLHGSAFAPRQNDPNVSGMWLERENGTFNEQLDRIRLELNASKRKVKDTHQLALVRAERIRQLGEKYSSLLEVVFCPDDDLGLPSHAEIRGIKLGDLVLQQKLADSAAIHPFKV
jgi:hypothetical protein